MICLSQYPVTVKCVTQTNAIFKVLLSSELFITYLLGSYFVCNVLYLAVKDPVFASLWYAYLFRLTYEEHSYQTCLGTLKWGHH